MQIDRRDKTRGQREPTNIVREVLCGNYDPKITPEIENRLREAARIRAAIAKALVEGIYTVFPPKKRAGSNGAEVSMANKRKAAKEAREARRRNKLEAVRQMCAELGIDEAELLRLARDRLELYRQQQRKKAGPPLGLDLRLPLRKPDGG